MRWIADHRNYSAPVAIGSVMRALAVGEIVESRHPDYRLGEIVTGWFGWQELATRSALWSIWSAPDLSSCNAHRPEAARRWAADSRADRATQPAVFCLWHALKLPLGRIKSPAMIRIAITDVAYNAIASTLPKGAARWPMQSDRDKCFIKVEAAIVDRMRTMRRTGESYSDVILRLVELESQGSA